MSNEKRPGNRKGSSEAAAERRIKALELRKAGASYRQIGTQLDVSECQAHRDVKRSLAALSRLEKHTADDLRRLELERLDAWLLALASQIKAGHLGAIDRGLRIAERRAKLLGLDAPAQADVTSGGKPIKGYAIISPDDWTGDGDAG